MTFLGESFNPRHNSLNALRLILATLVIVSHSWPIGGYGPDPGDGDLTLGSWAVAGFFAISGYLITASRMHCSGLLDYMWRRILRIYPAFVVVLVLVAFVFAPLSVAVAGSGFWNPASGMQYVLSNLGIRVATSGISGTLVDAPYPDAWNGSLWTLWYEFLCYVAMGIAISLLPRRVIPPATIIAVVGCSVATWALHERDLPLTIVNATTLGGYFAAGAVLYCYRARVPMVWYLAVLAAILIVGAAASSTFRFLASIPVAYLMMWLGSTLPVEQVGAKNDISYGMYIYAFPVQQLLVVFGLARVLPVWAFAVVAIVCTVPFAWLSWLLVERPAMRFKALAKRAGVPR